MGRPSTGAWTVYESLKIELTYLLKHNYFRKGRIASGNLDWSNQHGKKLGSIGVICCYGSLDTEKIYSIEIYSYRPKRKENRFELYGMANRSRQQFREGQSFIL